MKIIGIVLCLVCLAGCAPGLGKTLNTDYISPLPLEKTVQQRLSGVQLRTGDFIDARGVETIGEIDGRRLLPAGDVGQSVKRAFEDALRNGGADLSLYSGPMVKGEVLAWKIEVQPGFPVSEVNTEASLRVMVSSGSNRNAYSAIYSGTAEEKHPYLSETKIEELLGLAMAYAIREALRDQRLLFELAGGAR